MLAQEQPNRAAKKRLSYVIVKEKPSNKTKSACIEALKYYAALKDAEAEAGIDSLPFEAYSNESRDIALSVISDLEKFGFVCKLN